MAQIILGVGSSHSPQMSSGTDWWDGHASRDRSNTYLVGADGEVHSFEDLVSVAPSWLPAQLRPEVWTEKFSRIQDGVGALAKALGEAAPDIAVVVGDDQRELFADDGNPAIGLFLGEELWDRGLDEERKARMPADIRPAQWAAHGDSPEAYPVERSLSLHLAEALSEARFDIGVFSRQGEGRTLGHAFTFPRRRLGLHPATPIVPVILNTYYPPNVPSAARCWELGRAIREAIEGWGDAERVAVVATGGLSHFVISEELDRRVLGALSSGDVQTVGALPRKVLRSGTSEILNWVVLGGALADWSMELVDYVPAYRSEAGTGTAMGFALWTPPSN